MRVGIFVIATLTSVLSATAGYMQGVRDAEHAAALRAVEQLGADVKRLTSERDVEYWSHQCDLQRARERAEASP